MSDPAWASALAEVVADMRPVLVVLDTLARSVVGADENSTRDMGIAIEHLDMIRRAAGSCVLVVHHAGIDVTKGARGSTSLKAAMDTEIEVVGSENRVTVKNTKQKHGPEAAPPYFRLRGVPDTGSVVLEQAGAQPDPDEDLNDAAMATLNALHDIDTPEGSTSTAWRSAADVAADPFREVIVSTPRQVGKSLLMALVILDRMLAQPDAFVLFGAQSRMTARGKLLDGWWPMIARSELAERFTISRGAGFEALRCDNGSTLRLLSTEESSGHGESADLVVVDECWSLDARVEQAVRPPDGAPRRLTDLALLDRRDVGIRVLNVT